MPIAKSELTDTLRNTESPPEDYLAAGVFVDSDQPEIVEFAHGYAGTGEDCERVVNLYYAVRDRIDYDPYFVGRNPDYYRASVCLHEGRGFCIPKAALLAACCRAINIPARVGYADVRNHLSTTRLEELIGGDVYYWHSYTDTWIEGRWIKSTPAFNAELCERLNVHPLEFDGVNDSLFQEYNRSGERHMEYVNYRGAFADVPYERIVADFAAHHRNWLASRGD
ncbi:transglutaminase domain-containing protein [Pseudomonadota bacterium]